MLVLPLGPRARLYDFPWATAAVILITIVYSIAYMRFAHNVTRVMLNAPEREQMDQKVVQLLVAACGPLKLNPKACQFIQEHPRLLRDELLGLGSAKTKGAEVSMGELNQAMRYVFDTHAWDRVPDAVRDLNEFHQYQAGVQEYEGAISRFQREQGILSSKSVSIWSVLRAQFLHGGWMHLIGNMLFLILFALPVEQRLGAWATALVYFAGGTVGLLAHVALGSSGVSYCLGASANVFAVAGAFAFLFWRQTMRIWVSFFFLHNRTALIPVAAYIPLMLILGEVSGALAESGQGVAHVAHLGGFAAGLALTALVARIKPLAAGFTYPYEEKLWAAAEKSAGLEQRLRRLCRLLKHSPANTPAQDWAFATAVELHREMPVSDDLSLYLKSSFSDVFDRHLQQPTDAKTLDFLSQVPESWCLCELISDCDPQKVIAAADQLIESNEIMAIRLYDLYLTRFAKSSRAPAVRQTVKNLLQVMESRLSADELQSWIGRYLALQTKSVLTAELKAILNLSRAGDGHGQTAA